MCFTKWKQNTWKKQRCQNLKINIHQSTVFQINTQPLPASPSYFSLDTTFNTDIWFCDVFSVHLCHRIDAKNMKKLSNYNILIEKLGKSLYIVDYIERRVEV